MVPGVLDVELAFPRSAEKSGSIDLVQDGDNPTATAYELMAGNVLDLEALRWCCDVVDRDVVGRRIGGGGDESVGYEVRRQALGEVGDVVGTPAKIASFCGGAWIGVPSGKVGMWFDK